MAYKPGDTFHESLVFVVNGVPTNPDSIDSAVLWVNGSNDAAVTITVEAAAAITGASQHGDLVTGELIVTGTIPSGYSTGDCVAVRLAATLGTITYRGVISLGVLRTPLEDVVNEGKIAATLDSADVTGNLPADVQAWAGNGSLQSYESGGTHFPLIGVHGWDNNGSLQPVTVTNNMLEVHVSSITPSAIQESTFAAGAITVLVAPELANLDATVSSRAIPGSAMTLTTGERTAVANEVEAQIIDDTDSEKVLQAITDKIAAVNPSLDDLTLGAIAAAVRDEIERTAGMLKGVRDKTDQLTFTGTDVRATLDGETVTASTVSDKTGYALAANQTFSTTGAVGSITNVTFPINFGVLAIDGTGRVTAGTVADKSGYSISGTKTTLDALQDVSAAQVRTQADNALSAVGLTLTVTGRIDAPISTSTAGIATLLDRLTAARAGYMDKLNVTGVLANTDNAGSFKADVSGLLTLAQYNASTAQTAATRMLTMLEADGANYRYTESALINAPSSGGGLGSGDGDTEVDHNTGGTDALRYLDQDDVGIDNGRITAFLKSDYDAGLLVRRGQTRTRSDGRWVAPLLLNAGLTYTLVFDKDGEFQPVTQEITV